MEVTGWPITVLSRGRRIVEQGELVAKPGDGAFVKRGRSDLSGLTGTRLPETDPATNFGAEVLK
jgi:dihydropyrimidinase